MDLSKATTFIIDYETGELEQDDIIEGFQHLVDTGMINHLQGSYQRTALQLIEAGLVEDRSE